MQDEQKDDEQTLNEGAGPVQEIPTVVPIPDVHPVEWVCKRHGVTSDTFDVSIRGVPVATFCVHCLLAFMKANMGVVEPSGSGR